MVSLVEELAKTYIDGMPLDTIKDKIEDIVTTYYKDNIFIINIYLNDYSYILIRVDLNDKPSFSISSSYINRAIGEIINYFKILGFKEI